MKGVQGDRQAHRHTYRGSQEWGWDVCCDAIFAAIIATVSVCSGAGCDGLSVHDRPSQFRRRSPQTHACALMKSTAGACRNATRESWVSGELGLGSETTGARGLGEGWP